MTDMPTYEQFKWHLLGEAGGNLEVATAYGIARMHFPLKPGDEIAELVRVPCLSFYDEGLIVSSVVITASASTMWDRPTEQKSLTS